jgi:hypothetical protein
MTFRSYAIFSLASILQNRSQNTQNITHESQDTHNLIDKITSVMEIHLVCNSASVDTTSHHEYPLLFFCIQRLINSAVPIILEYSPDSPYLANLIKMWSVIRKSYPLIFQLQSECADFLLSFSAFPLTIFDPFEVVDFIKDSLKSPERTSIEHLSKIVGCIKILILTDSNIVCQVNFLSFSLSIFP